MAGVVLASGMSYRVLVLPPGRTMTPALLAKIKDLVAAGATVVGPRPASSPSLADYPHCDAEVQHIGGGDLGRLRWREHYRKPLWQRQSGVGKAPGGCSGSTGYAAGLRLPGRGRERANSLHPPHVSTATTSTLWPAPSRRRKDSCAPSASKESGRNCGGRTRDGLNRLRFTTKRATARWSRSRSTPTVRCSWFSVRPSLPDRVISIRRDGVEISGLAPSPLPKSNFSMKPWPLNACRRRGIPHRSVPSREATS